MSNIASDLSVSTGYFYLAISYNDRNLVMRPLFLANINGAFTKLKSE